MNLTKLKTLLISEISAVSEPANGLDGWMISKSRGGRKSMRLPAAMEVDPVVRKRRDIIIEAADRLRTACADDELFTALVKGESFFFTDTTGETQLLTKARTGHPGTENLRNPDDGTYVPVTLNGFTLQGAVHPALRRLAAAAGKREPQDDGEKGLTAYDADPAPNPGGDGTNF